MFRSFAPRSSEGRGWCGPIADGWGSEMFLGPAHKDFRFQPKHKSNSYEIEAEG